MKTLVASPVVLALALALLPAPSANDDDPSRKPWFVRAALIADSLPCEGAYVRFHLGSWTSEPLVIPLESVGANDAEWSVKSLNPGVHEMHAQVVSCGGVAGPLATLDFENSASTRRKEIYIGVRSSYEVFTLDYVEIATEWDGSQFVSIERDDEGVLVTNTSGVTLRRCEYEPADIYEEFLVDGIWGAFDRGGMRRWPESVANLEPGKVMTMMPAGVRVIQKRTTDPRVVRPDAKRYVLVVQPMRQSYMTLTEPPWAPAGLPSCDRYYVEEAVSETDPSLKIWDQNADE